MVIFHFQKTNQMYFTGIWLVLFLGTAMSAAQSDELPLQVAADTGEQEETVVLLHGIGRGRASLWVLDTRLQQAGYKTLNFPYVAQGYSLEEVAQQFCLFLEENVTTERYHLIAHSLGNLIIRMGFRYGYPEGLGRIVMLAPPNRPTELARALRDNPIYKWFTGKDGWQFASDEFYAQLPVPDAPFGIVAGARGQAVMLHEPNDGVITVESTKLEGMADWIVVPHAHTFIMNSRSVAELCASFIKEGKFDRTKIPKNEEIADGANSSPVDADETLGE